jgi:hypothetical protein
VLIEIGSHLPFFVHFDNRKVDLPHIWGTDELKRKSPDSVLASEAILSSEEIALQFQNPQIRGRATFRLSKTIC